jgi:multiple sugar transport system ATP-binding protein
MASIRLERVDKVFPNGRRAVCSLDLDVADRELVVLVGPSGCGKTTILRMIAGLESPTAGRVYLDNLDVTALPPQKRDLAMVFQSHTLYPHKTVRENLGFSLRLRGAKRADIDERIHQVAHTLRLDSILDGKPGQFSGGERQRVALGRAMVRRPRAFLLDEPLSNLDAQLRVQLRGEIARLHQEFAATMLYVTHDQEEAMMLGDRVAVLREGKLQQIGSPLEIYRRPANLFVAGFIGSPAMNFFRAKLQGQGGISCLETPWFKIQMDGTLRSGNDGDAILGTRPGEIRLVETGEAEAHALIETVQPLGHEVVVRAALVGTPQVCSITLVLPPDRKMLPHQQIGIVFPREKLHLFDAVGGARLN